jgi:N-acetylglucosamine kinase-like BadF-type ATPase
LSEGENPTSCTGNGRPASGAIDNPWTSRNSRNAGKPPRRLFLGVDGGGTSTEACVMDHRGTVLGIGRGGPSNINYVDQTELADSIRTAVNKCLALSGISLDDIAGACLALAGAGDENPKRIRGAVLPFFGNCPFTIVEDTYSALAAAHEEGDGIVVMAGTGSNCVGMRNGRYASAGGYGALLGDEGSAYSIALRGLRKVMRAFDGREPSTALTSLFLTAMEAGKPRDFIHLTLGMGRADIAALSQIVFRAADELRDGVAVEILRAEAAELVEMVCAVARKLDLRAPNVAARGGCFKSATYLSALQEELSRVLPEAKLFHSTTPASLGAAVLARTRFAAKDGSEYSRFSEENRFPKGTGSR